MTQHLVSELAGRADLIDQCLPDYPPYGKRILLDNGWFRSLLNPKVTLVTDPVARVEHDAVVTTDGTRRPADVIVLATGFQVTEMAARLDITGRDGHNLREVWADDNRPRTWASPCPAFQTCSACRDRTPASGTAAAPSSSRNVRLATSPAAWWPWPSAAPA